MRVPDTVRAYYDYLQSIAASPINELDWYMGVNAGVTLVLTALRQGSPHAAEQISRITAELDRFTMETIAAHDEQQCARRH